MAAEFFDYDPIGAVETLTEQDDNITVVHRRQDLSGLLELAKAERNARLSEEGIKKGWMKAMTVPCVAQVEMHALGIPFPPNGKDELKRVTRFMLEKYPMFVSEKRFV